MTTQHDRSRNYGWRASKWSVLVVASLAVHIDMLLYGVIIPIQPRLLEESGIPRAEGDWYQTLLFCVYALGLLVATPIFGIISDRTQNRQLPMLFGLVALAASTLIFAYVRSFYLLMAARVSQGISAAATWVVGFAMVADAFPSDNGLGLATGIVMSSHSLGSFLGPLVGGFLGEYYGLEYPFIFCALLALVDLGGRLVICPPAPPAPAASGKPVSMRTLLGNRGIRHVLGTMLIISCSYSALEVAIAPWLQDQWGFSESKTSMCMLGFIIPNMFVSVPIGWLVDRVPCHLIITTGLVLHAIASPLIPLARSLPTLLLFEAIFGATAPIASSPLSPQLASLVDQMGDNYYARTYAMLNMTYSVGMILGPWAVGLVRSVLGFGPGMTLIGLACLVYAPFFYYGSRPFARAPRPKSVDAESPPVGAASTENFL